MVSSLSSALAPRAPAGYHFQSKGGEMIRKEVLWGLFFLAFFVAFGCSAAQLSPIVWDQQYPIEWSDFLGTPPDRPMAEAAMIDMRVTWRVEYVVFYDPNKGKWRGNIPSDQIQVQNTMDPLGSWLVPGKANPALLDHERRHFDLNEVYARRLREELARITVSGNSVDEVKQALSTRINRTAERVLSTLTGMQKLYDAETSHGTDPSAQRSWDAQIDSWLNDPLSAPATVGGMGTGSGTMNVQSG